MRITPFVPPQAGGTCRFVDTTAKVLVNKRHVMQIQQRFCKSLPLRSEMSETIPRPEHPRYTAHGTAVPCGASAPDSPNHQFARPNGPLETPASLSVYPRQLCQSCMPSRACLHIPPNTDTLDSSKDKRHFRRYRASESRLNLRKTHPVQKR